MRKRIGKYVLPLFAASMLVFAVIHVVRAQQEPPRPPPPVEPARTPFGRTVAGAGIIEGRYQNIAVGSALPGVVQEVYAQDESDRPDKKDMPPWEKLIGQHVKAGQPLFRVDDRQLRATRAFHQANLESARAQLEKLVQMPRKEELEISQAKRETACASLELQRDLAARGARLVASQSIAEEDYRQRVLTAKVAQAQLTQAGKDLELTRAGAWAPDVKIAEAAVKLAEAQVKQDETDIERAVVRAPMDAFVLQVNVRPGEFVGAAPGTPLVVLGGVTDRVHVRVDVDEHDIPRFKPGAPASASLRGAPEKRYPLQFVRIEPYVIPKRSLTGENTERVDTRVLQVIYSLKTRGKPVYVGQQLDVFVDVAPDAAKPVAPPESAGG
jgi:multidrug efflux pump subunit AcrA (membrane-fusion protein)